MQSTANQSDKIAPYATGPSPWRLFKAFQKPETVLRFWETVTKEFPEAMGYKFGGLRYFVGYNGDIAKHMFVDNLDNYPKGKSHDNFRLMIGSGLVSSDGAYWKSQRRLLQPIFSRTNFEAVFPLMVECVKKERAQLTTGTRVDFGQLSARTTMGIILDVLFGADLQEQERSDFIEAFDEANWTMFVRYYSLFQTLPITLPIPNNIRLRRAGKRISGITKKIIERRKGATAKSKVDFLSLLMSAKDPETGEMLSEEALHDESITFIFAGYETTANAITWALYRAARHPEIYEKASTEARKLRSLDAPTISDLDELKYIPALFKEAMRMYPPAWGVSRMAAGPDVVNGFRVDPGTICFVLINTIHRDPRYWERPDDFWPERFLGENPCKHKFGFIPFIFGPRVCIGQAFALLEAHLILAMLLGDKKFALEKDEDEPARVMITLKPERPIWAKVV